jgi:BirA family transcriptional regulator, biotin operon repressor / biotin---[acetyl-CoA-carboxylase] ligase
MRFKPLSAVAIQQDLGTQVIGRQVTCVRVTASTNDWLRAAAAEGAPEGAVVFAEEQTAGRGQVGRHWIAPAGCCILTSILLRPAVPPDRLSALTMLAACAAAAAAIETTGLPIQLKWPNDLISDLGKVGGVLVESSLIDGQVEHAILGIGINVNQSRRALAGLPGAASLCADLGRMVDRTKLARALLRALDERYTYIRDNQDAAILREWRERLVTLGKWVSLRSGASAGGTYFASEVTDQGALVLLRPDGTTFESVAGEVSIVPEM